MALDRSTGIQHELESVTAQLTKAKLQLEIERKQVAAERTRLPDTLLESELAKDPEAAQLRVQINKLQRTLSGYAETARGGAKAAGFVAESIKGYQADLAAAQKKLEQRQEEIRVRLTKQFQQALDQNSKEVLKPLEAQIELWTEEEKQLRQRLQGQMKETEDLARRSWVDVEALLKDAERKLEAVKHFSAELEMIRKEVQRAPQVHLLLEAAWPPL